MKKKLGSLMQGVLGNYTEQSIESLETEYGKYLFDNENITSGYKLVRDALVFTNLRIIFIDKQGATGKKTRIKSIYLISIIDVEMETAGAGIDDSEINISYLVNVRRKAYSEVIATVKFEFPKTTDIVPLYTMLGNLAYQNRLEINE